MDAIRKISTSLPGVIILEPRVFGDERGFFLESYNRKVFAELGIERGRRELEHGCRCGLGVILKGYLRPGESGERADDE